MNEIEPKATLQFCIVYVTIVLFVFEIGSRYVKKNELSEYLKKNWQNDVVARPQL